MKVLYKVQLFANDCLTYRTKRSNEDISALQDDLKSNKNNSGLDNVLQPKQMWCHYNYQQAEAN